MNGRSKDNVIKNNGQNAPRHKGDKVMEENSHTDLSAEVDRVILQYPEDPMSSENPLFTESSEEDWTEVWEYDEGFERWLHHLSQQQSRKSDEVIRKQEGVQLSSSQAGSARQKVDDKTFNHPTVYWKGVSTSSDKRQDESCQYSNKVKSNFCYDDSALLAHGFKNLEDINTIGTSTCARCQREIQSLEIGILLNLLTSSTTARFLNHYNYYTCEICKINLNKKGKLIRHVSWHIFRNEAYCSECRNELKQLQIQPMYSKNEDFAEYRLSASDRKQLKKDTCNYDKPPTCKLCGNVFDYFIPLLVKVVEFKMERKSLFKSLHKFICHYCKDDTISRNHIVQHVMNHIDAGEIVCNLCRIRK